MDLIGKRSLSCNHSARLIASSCLAHRCRITCELFVVSLWLHLRESWVHCLCLWSSSQSHHHGGVFNASPVQVTYWAGNTSGILILKTVLLNTILCSQVFQNVKNGPALINHSYFCSKAHNFPNKLLKICINIQIQVETSELSSGQHIMVQIGEVHLIN